MSRIMVCLVSRQPMPNYIGAMQPDFRPDRIAYIYTAEERATKTNLKRVLPIPTVDLPDKHLLVNAYHFDEIEAACEQVLTAYPDSEVILNVTGGTKIMALSAFDIFKRHNQPIIYVDTANHEIIQFAGQQRERIPIQVKIDVLTYLKIYRQNARIQRVVVRKTDRGQKLENYSFQLLQRLPFDDIQQNVIITWGMEDGTPKNEFDVVATHRCQLYVFECKSGAVSQDDLFRLQGVKQLAGGLFARAFLVTHTTLSDRFRARVQELGIETIEGNEEITKIHRSIRL